MRFGFGLSGATRLDQGPNHRHGPFACGRFVCAEIGNDTSRIVRPGHGHFALLFQQGQARPVRALGKKRLVVTQPHVLIPAAQPVPNVIGVVRIP